MVACAVGSPGYKILTWLVSQFGGLGSTAITEAVSNETVNLLSIYDYGLLFIIIEQYLVSQYPTKSEISICKNKDAACLSPKVAAI